MSIPKKTHEPIRQNGEIVKKSQKHDANLQKNSTIYFQVGLIVCLLVAYGLLEMKFESTIQLPVCSFGSDEGEDLYVFNDPVKVFEEEVEKEKFKKKSPTIFREPIISENDPSIVETLDIFTEPTVFNESPVDPRSIKVIAPPDPVDIPVAFVEVVPIYPGCENAKNNEERRKCMSDKINKLVQKKFDGNIASEYGLSGVQRINVEFKIDKTGHVTDIKSRATHPKLEEEAERVVNKIPVMLPGKQQNKPVGVIYSLPIVFKVQN